VFVGAEAGADAVAWHLRHRIEVAASASLRVIEHHLAHGVHRHLDTATLAVSVAQDALLEHARVQGPADGATSFARTDAVLQARAGYHRVDLELGGALSRHELNVRLEGEGASLAAHGVLLANGRRHVDTRLGIEHAARDTRCELLWRGIGAGRGHVVFHGGITIHPGADGTDARLSNKNLLLSPNAEIDTQPVLVIHADEVQAAHGATVGQLDANALFYLRARGVPQAEARQMLTAAVCREPLAAVADAAVGDALLARPAAAPEAPAAGARAAPGGGAADGGRGARPRAAGRGGGRRGGGGPAGPPGRGPGGAVGMSAGSPVQPRPPAPAGARVDWARVRADFPLLRRTVHGK